MTTAPVPRPAPAVDSSDDDEEDDDVFFDAAEDFSEEYGPPRALPSSGKSGDSLTVRPAGRGALGMPGRHSAPPPQQPPSSYRPQPAPRPKVNPPRPQPTPQAEQQQPELKPRPAPQLPPRTASPGAPPLVKQESFSDKLLASMQVSRSASPRSADDMITATLVETGPLAPPTPARAPDRAAAGSPDSSSAPAGSKNSMIKPVASPVAATATSAPARPVAQPNRVPPVPPRLPPRPSIVQQQGAPGDAPALPPRLPPRPSLSRPVPPPRPSSSEPEPEAEEPHVFRDAEMTPMMIKNLDTGEMCYIDQAPAVFQEVAKAEHAGMTLDQFDRSAAGSKREQAGRTGRNGRMSADDASLPSESAEETKEKKKAIGVMANIRRLLRNSLKQSNASDNNIKVKVHGKRLKELTKLRLIQEVFDHAGPVWTAKFSHDGFFLATGGQDSIVRIWAVAGSPAAQEMMANGGRPVSDDDEAAAEAPDGAAPDGGPGDDAPEGADEEGEGQVEGSTGESGDTTTPLEDLAKDIPAHLGGREFIMKRPYRMYSGHKNDVIDVSWSKANFLLSASIDRTVRLWHVTRQQCLRVFVHNDFVTSVAFHPVEDRFFVSGSFDKKLRIWSVVEHCVVEWAPAASVITGVSFSPSGDQVVAGLYNGLCVFYQTEGLKYYTQVECRNRSGKFKAGTKVTGVEFSPNGRHLLVTTNDSRIRLFSVDDFSCLAKFKGLRNLELQIRARFSEDGRSVLCGSDNNLVHLWDVTTGVQDDSNAGKVKMDRNDRYEYFKAHATTVTTAQFVPRASIIISSPEQRPDQVKHLIVSSDYNGKIKIFENTGEPELKS